MRMNFPMAPAVAQPAPRAPVPCDECTAPVTPGATSQSLGYLCPICAPQWQVGTLKRPASKVFVYVEAPRVL